MTVNLIAVEKALRAVELEISMWAPHGMDSSRVGDYRMRDAIQDRLDDVREACGLEPLHRRPRSLPTLCGAPVDGGRCLRALGHDGAHSPRPGA